MMNIMYFVYTDWDKQKEREGKCVLSNIRTPYVAIISNNLHEYLTSILHNLIQQLLWNTWILFLRFQSIYIEFSVSPCTENNENNMSNVNLLKLIHTFTLVWISNYDTHATLQLFQFYNSAGWSINILSEIFWSCVDKLVLNL